MSYLVIAAHVALFGVFVMSGIAKAYTFDSAVAMVRSLPGVSAQRPAASATRVLIGAEAGAGVCAILSFSWVGLAPAVALLCLFTGLAVASAVGWVNTRCACFGRSTVQLGWRHVWRNLALLAVAAIGLTGDDLTKSSLATSGVVVAVAAALLIVTLSVFYDDIVDLFATP